MYAPTAAYRVGRATENKARAVLHGAGFVTLRSWMSRSPADLVAMRAASESRVPLGTCAWGLGDCALDSGHDGAHVSAYQSRPAALWLVQVKKHGYMPPAERVALLAMAAQAGATPVLCRMESDGSLTFHVMTGDGIRDLQEVEP